MKIYKTAMAIKDDDKAIIYTADTIEFEGKMWIVPTWLESPFLSYKTPERIVCIENLPHQKNALPGIDFVLNYPIPKDVLHGQPPSELKGKYVVKMHPDIKVSLTNFV